MKLFDEEHLELSGTVRCCFAVRDSLNFPVVPMSEEDSLIQLEYRIVTVFHRVFCILGMLNAVFQSNIRTDTNTHSSRRSTRSDQRERFQIVHRWSVKILLRRNGASRHISYALLQSRSFSLSIFLKRSLLSVL